MVKKFMKVAAMRLAALLPHGKISEEVCTLCVEMVHQSKHTKSMDTRDDPPGHHLLQAKWLQNLLHHVCLKAKIVATITGRGTLEQRDLREKRTKKTK
jgi:hypothetical protein